MGKKILVIDDHYEVFIEELGTILENLEEIEQPLLKKRDPYRGLELMEKADLILLDLKFDQYDEGKSDQEYRGFEVLRQIKAKKAVENVWIPPVIVLTSYHDIDNIALAFELGSLFFLEKEFSSDAEEQIRQTILSALQKGESEKNRLELWRQRNRIEVMDGTDKFLVGRSAVMQKVYDQLEDAAKSDKPVLILGETGVGKELVARAIHHRWENNKGGQPRPFIDMNASIISTDRGLMISELFGCPWGHPHYEDTGQVGCFQLACGIRYPDRQGWTEEVPPAPQPPDGPIDEAAGTLFLDEIGEMPYAAQTMLLRVIETKKATDLYGHEYDTAPRIICATNRELTLEESTPNSERRNNVFQNELLGVLRQLVEVTGGRTLFRKDLLRRLDVIRIEVPPLNDRKEEDMDILIDYFCERANQELGKNVKFVLPATREQFKQCNWKDQNVRVLEILIWGCVRHSDGQVLELSPQTEKFFQQSNVTSDFHEGKNGTPKNS